MLTIEKTKTRLRRFGMLLGVAVALLLTGLPVASAQSALVRAQRDWEAFVKQRSPDAPPRPGEIICIGSSHMARWTSVGRDLAPLTVYNFGIGGTTMKDAARAFARNLVIPYKPRSVILYEGSNDIARDSTPDQILDQFRDFYGQVHEALPETRLYVLGVVPSPGIRFKRWDTIKLANATLEHRINWYGFRSYQNPTDFWINAFIVLM